jgi:UDP-2,3-diacylglucosamine hydrolase
MVINDGAIFIADAHYNSERTTLYTMLIDIESNKIKTTQLILMGDIFDFLSCEIKYFQKINSKIIQLINHLSQKIDILYLEGNHDFNLKQLFPKIDVIPRKQQPLNIVQNNQQISLAHGDIFTPFGYNIFSSIFRSCLIQNILNIVDINYWLSSLFEKKLIKKNICHKQKNFTQFIHNRVQSYNTDLIIEGHYHQGYIDNRYINIPSLACDNSYMIYKNNQFSFNIL